MAVGHEIIWGEIYVTCSTYSLLKPAFFEKPAGFRSAKWNRLLHTRVISPYSTSKANNRLHSLISI